MAAGTRRQGFEAALIDEHALAGLQSGLLIRALCGMRVTPDRSMGARGSHHAWVREGVALFEALRTARQHSFGQTETFGEIVVPAGGPPAQP